MATDKTKATVVNALNAVLPELYKAKQASYSLLAHLSIQHLKTPSDEVKAQATELLNEHEELTSLAASLLNTRIITDDERVLITRKTFPTLKIIEVDPEQGVLSGDPVVMITKGAAA